MSDSIDSPGELSFVSEHDTDSDSSDTSAYRQRQKREKEEEEKKKEKKKKMKKRSERRLSSPSACETAVDSILPSPGERKMLKIIKRPMAGQTNGAFEPDTDD